MCRFNEMELRASIFQQYGPHYGVVQKSQVNWLRNEAQHGRYMMCLGPGGSASKDCKSRRIDIVDDISFIETVSGLHELRYPMQAKSAKSFPLCMG